jgi:Rad3-related DNA helicase
MSTTKPVIKISVRHLVEFILRCGDIDSGFSGSNRAAEGARIHRKIQKQQKNANYDAEVFVKTSVEREQFIFIIDGRIDGVVECDGQYCIDEIKSVTESVKKLHENDYPLHWAQVKCYAYMFCAREQLTDVQVRLIYAEVESGEIRQFTRMYTYNELKIFFDELIEKYEPWAKFSFEWSVKRNESLKNLKFPFGAYRPGQWELAAAAYRSIKNKNNLFAKAPTGIGKTVSTLFPALKAMGEGLTSKIFYLTAKTITRTVAEDTLSLIRSHNAVLKSVTLTAKEKICFKDKTSCRPATCEYAKGHYDRINDCLWDILQNDDDFRRAAIEPYAEKHRVCPFELSLDISMWCDIIVSDYNYVFDPQVYLKRFFSEGTTDFTFLVDEAHNLVDRSREMFSAQVLRSPFAMVRKPFKKVNTELYRNIGRINTKLKALGKLCDEKGEFVSSEVDENLSNALEIFVAECERFLIRTKGIDNDALLQLYFDSLIFLKITELFDARYTFVVTATDTEVTAKLFCVDPSFLMSETLKRGRSTIFFSATLAPLEYYRKILGGTAQDKLIELSSPFDKANRSILVAGDLSTRYQNRDKSVNALAGYLQNIIAHKMGNYMVFFPSYQYMNSVVSIIQEQPLLFKLITQTSKMKEHERDAFLENFKEDPQETVVGFCVLGGLFSEGIDLKSDRLIGSIIVGVGLPQICTERDIIREYFQHNQGCGFEYAYLYPGMNKVMQAAGRVIRSERDRGIIVLIDERYLSPTYRSLFPEEWFPYNQVNAKVIGERIKGFWGIN